MNLSINGMKNSHSTRAKGFTIIELLIAIVVLGILAGLAVTSYGAAQQRAKIAKARSDVNALERTLRSAQAANGIEAIRYISGSAWTMQNCIDGSILKNLPQTHDCWVKYHNLLDQIQPLAGVNLDAYRKGDPWGSPYLIDENEMEVEESDPGCYRTDAIHSAGPNGKWDSFSNDDILMWLPRYKTTSDC